MVWTFRGFICQPPPLGQMHPSRKILATSLWLFRELLKRFFKRCPYDCSWTRLSFVKDYETHISPETAMKKIPSRRLSVQEERGAKQCSWERWKFVIPVPPHLTPHPHLAPSSTIFIVCLMPIQFSAKKKSWLHREKCEGRPPRPRPPTPRRREK